MGKSEKNKRGFDVSPRVRKGWSSSTLIASPASRNPFPSELPLVALIVFFTFASLSSSLLTLSHASPNETTRVSVSSSGEEGNGSSDPFSSFSRASISADGRYVLFRSRSNNLVVGDTNGTDDLFLHDRHVGNTLRVTDFGNGVALGAFSNTASISADGRYVAYISGSFNPIVSSSPGISIYDQQSGSTSQLPETVTNPIGVSTLSGLTLNADGRYVAISESHTEPGNPHIFGESISVHDRQTGNTTLVSGTFQNGSSFSETPSLSADGRYVAFRSNARNLVPGDTNSTYDIFVYDQQTGETTRVSESSSGEQGALPSYGVSINADGRYVAFSSAADNLVSGDTNNATDVFVHDRQNRNTVRVSVSSGGDEGSGTNPSISADGRFVMFESGATNLVPGDTNGSVDVFVHDRLSGATSRVSVASSGEEGDDRSEDAASSADGRYVVFDSDATNLVPGDTNGFDDVFVHERGGAVSGAQSLTVRFSGVGTGTVTSHVTGIDCGADCSEDYMPGSLITLTATPTVGSVFTGWTRGTDWSGTSCSGTGTCTVVMTQAHTVMADFSPLGGGRNVSMGYVRLVADSEVNGNHWTSMAELTLLDPHGMPLDQSNWTLVSVDSEELVGENGSARNAFDGNSATIWHTAWSGVSVHPHEIVIRLGSTQTVSGFRYLPRQDGGENGRISEYQFYGSHSSQFNGAPLAVGTFANTAEEQQVAFGGDLRYIRLVAQSEVNGNPWTSMAELTVLDRNGTPLDQSNWTLQSVDSEELVGENGAAVNAFDGNPGTFWHTQWSSGSSSHPHEIIIDLGEQQAVSGFEYLPRQDGGINGRIANFKFYGSTDGVNWGYQLAEGTFADTDQDQQVVFDGTRYILLVANSEVNGNPLTSVAELTALDRLGIPLEKGSWKLESVSSQELVGENGAARNAFDGNPDTFWHTRWSSGNDTHPHRIRIDLGWPQEISGIRYLPRQDGGVNGRIAEYSFFGSPTFRGGFKPLASGTFADTDQEQEVLF